MDSIFHCLRWATVRSTGVRIEAIVRFHSLSAFVRGTSFFFGRGVSRVCLTKALSANTASSSLRARAVVIYSTQPTTSSARESCRAPRTGTKTATRAPFSRAATWMFR